MEFGWIGIELSIFFFKLYFDAVTQTFSIKELAIYQEFSPLQYKFDYA